MKPDQMLEFAIAVALGVGDKTDGRFDFQITLSVSGLLVTGQIISGRDFMQSVAAFNGVEDLFPNETTPEAPLKPIDSGFIHLKDARFFSNAQAMIPPATGGFWRIKTDRVDGFSFGRVSS